MLQSLAGGRSVLCVMSRPAASERECRFFTAHRIYCKKKSTSYQSLPVTLSRIPSSQSLIKLVILVQLQQQLGRYSILYRIVIGQTGSSHPPQRIAWYWTVRRLGGLRLVLAAFPSPPLPETFQQFRKEEHGRPIEPPSWECRARHRCSGSTKLWCVIRINRWIR